MGLCGQIIETAKGKNMVKFPKRGGRGWGIWGENPKRSHGGDLPLECFKGTLKLVC